MADPAPDHVPEDMPGEPPPIPEQPLRPIKRTWVKPVIAGAIGVTVLAGASTFDYLTRSYPGIASPPARVGYWTTGVLIAEPYPLQRPDTQPAENDGTPTDAPADSD